MVDHMASDDVMPEPPKDNIKELQELLLDALMAKILLKMFHTDDEGESHV